MKARWTTLTSAAWLTLWFGSGIFFLRASSSYDLSHILVGPGFPHFMGFDAFGRDLLRIVLKASWLSATFAGATVLFSCIAALGFGALISFAPAGLRFAFLRLLETLLAFPSLLFALAFAAVRGPGWDTLIFSLLIGLLPSFTRLIHVRMMELANEEYVLAARSLGAGPGRILLRHLLKPLLSLCAVKMPNLFAHALLAEATLSFLGVGAPIGQDTWGSLLAQGKDYLFETPHIAVGTGVPLVLTVLALQLLTESHPDR